MIGVLFNIPMVERTKFLKNFLAQPPHFAMEELFGVSAATIPESLLFF